MTEADILNCLDHSNNGQYSSFVDLGHPYLCLIDARLNVFRGKPARWAIVIEHLYYSPRAGAIMLDIHYYGNCLVNLENYNDQPTNYYSIYLIDAENFDETTDGESIRPEAKYWLVRGQQVALSHYKEDYVNAGIELKEYEPNEIRVEEAARLAILHYRDLFRATDQELFKSIPSDLQKILVLDEWFHKEFRLQEFPSMTDEALSRLYESNKQFGLGKVSFEQFVQSFRQQEISTAQSNQAMWDNNRPSAYETWPLLAKVIVTNDPKQYQPTLSPNTHWLNWPESGSM